MTMKVLLASLAAGAVALPSPVEAPAAATAPDLTIRSVTLNPASPVVGPVGAVRLVVEVVARGVAGPEGVTIQVEPGVPPEPSRVGTFPVSASGSVSASVPGGSPDRGRPACPARSPGRGRARRPVAGGPGSLRSPGSGDTGFPGVDGGPIPSSDMATGQVAERAARVLSRAGQDWETWRFAPDKSLSRWYRAGTWTVAATAREASGTTVTGYTPFWLKRETRFGAVQAVRKGTEVQVDGVFEAGRSAGSRGLRPVRRPARRDHAPPETTQAAWTQAATAASDTQGSSAGRAGPSRRGVADPLRGNQASHAARLGQGHRTAQTRAEPSPGSLRSRGTAPSGQGVHRRAEQRGAGARPPGRSAAPRSGGGRAGHQRAGQQPVAPGQPPPGAARTPAGGRPAGSATRARADAAPARCPRR